MTALVVRLVYVSQLEGTELADELLFNRDGDYYHLRATQIAAGDWLGAWPGYMSPAYCWFVASIYKIAGVAADAVRLPQALLGAATCTLVWALGRNLFTPRVALIGAALAVLYRPHVFYTSWLLPTVLVTALHLALAVVLTKRGALRSPATALASGALIALAALAKANALLFWPAIVLWHLWFSRSERGDETARATPGGRLKWIAALSLGVAVLLAPSLARDRIVSGESVLITTTGGLNLAKGNGPTANGTHVVIPRELSESSTFAAYLRGGVDASAVVRDDDEARRWTMAYVAEHPLRTARLALTKARLLLAAVELGVHDRIDFTATQVALLRAPAVSAGWLLPIALTGLLFAPWRDPHTSLVRGLIACSAMSLVIVFVLARYRLPLVMMSIPFAAWQIDAWASMLHRRAFGPLAASLSVAVAAALLVHAPLPGVDPDEGLGDTYALLGDARAARGDCDEALEAYNAAFERPWRQSERLPLSRWRSMERRAACMRRTGDTAGATRLIDRLRAELEAVEAGGVVPYLSPERGPGAEPFALSARERTIIRQRLRKLSPSASAPRAGNVVR